VCNFSNYIILKEFRSSVGWCTRSLKRTGLLRSGRCQKHLDRFLAISVVNGPKQSEQSGKLSVAKASLWGTALQNYNGSTTYNPLTFPYFLTKAITNSVLPGNSIPALPKHLYKSHTSALGGPEFKSGSSLCGGVVFSRVQWRDAYDFRKSGCRSSQPPLSASEMGLVIQTSGMLATTRCKAVVQVLLEFLVLDVNFRTSIISWSERASVESGAPHAKVYAPAYVKLEVNMCIHRILNWVLVWISP
jgi:hypothetical protein